MVRVRLAPSPTGMMHIGTARLGLFVWLFARQHEGKFILRIEDTDKERYKEEYEKSIIDGLEALGFKWDEFYKQSERTAIYREYLERLIAEDKVYPCFCTKDELDAERAEAEKEKHPVIYSGKCAAVSREEAAKRVAAGEPHVWRFRMPASKIAFEDMVRGHVEYDTSLIGDVVVAKGLNEPLYNFVVVIDDITMGITHVIRGEDHLSNTPKQIAVFKALGEEPPKFAHLPLILNADRSKMSKRGGDTALVDFLDKGYLPEAIINFLALLSWHPKDDREIFSLEDLIKEFDFERIQKGGAVFDFAKLNWINRYYINHILSSEEIIRRAGKFLPAGWQPTVAMIDTVKSRLDNLFDLKDALAVYFEPLSYEAELLHFKGKAGNTVGNLRTILSVLEGAAEGDLSNPESAEKLLSGIVPTDAKGEWLWPLRVALSGRQVSPGPYEMAVALGKEETVARVRQAVEKLS